MKRTFNVMESSSIPKNRHSPNEDVVYIGDAFVAVVDGASSKLSRGEALVANTPGKAAAAAVVSALERLPVELDSGRAVEFISRTLRDCGLDRAVAAASIAIFSTYREEIWLVGSASFVTDGLQHSNRPTHEAAASKTRAAFTTALLRQGLSVEELRRTDPGRQVVLPLLSLEHHLRNVDLPGEYYFGMIDGTPVPERHIIVKKVDSQTNHIILASDGYPIVRSDLQATEREYLTAIGQDPLCITSHPQTKGVGVDALGFDDRSYVSLRRIRS